jgi:hypothetical protein
MLWSALKQCINIYQALLKTFQITSVNILSHGDFILSLHDYGIYKGSTAVLSVESVVSY